MSGFLLDTKCISELVRPKPDPRVFAMRSAVSARTWVFSRDPDSPSVREALTGGRKKDAPDQGQKGKVDKKGAGKKITSPRKAGGS